MKTVFIFRCGAMLKPETTEKIKQRLLKDLEEGVVVTDASLQYIKTVVPKDCEFDVVIETMEDE